MLTEKDELLKKIEALGYTNMAYFRQQGKRQLRAVLEQAALLEIIANMAGRPRDN